MGAGSLPQGLSVARDNAGRTLSWFGIDLTVALAAFSFGTRLVAMVEPIEKNTPYGHLIFACRSNIARADAYLWRGGLPPLGCEPPQNLPLGFI
ncbi:hypothetical protein EMIT0P291_60055 [Pseudomonas sp. IT-P291]